MTQLIFRRGPKQFCLKDEICRLEFDKILAVNPLEKRNDISLLGPVLMIRPSLKTDPSLRFFVSRFPSAFLTS